MIAVWNRESATLLPVSLNYSQTGAANGDSFSPAISPDGRYIAFASRATDLVRPVVSSITDVYLHDRLLRQTLLLASNQPRTALGCALSTRPVFSQAGRSILFLSFRSDLVPIDYNQASDLLLVRLVQGDSDNDGLDDSWEATCFGNLARDGSGEFDNDSMNDLEQFKAGTNPTNNNSIFRVITLSRATAHNAITVVWNSTPGKAYQVQFKDNLSTENWSALEEPVTATGTTSRLDDRSGDGRLRFYRVVQLD